MCHDVDATPPPTGGTQPATGEDLVLVAADGAATGAYLARPDGDASGIGLVLLPDAHGLSDFYRRMALRFAEAGLLTLTVDFYGRTAGTEPRDEEGFDFEPHLARLRRDEMLADTAAAVDHLRAGLADRVFVAGFCMGGGTALLSGTTGMRPAGVVGFYAYTGELGLDPALPDDFVTGISCPVLGLFGGADTAVDPVHPRAFEGHLAAAGVPHEIVIYPDQPHGFFELDVLGRAGHAEAAADAWRRLRAFVSPAG